MLFTNFVNEFPTRLRKSQGNMFADDTMCYAQKPTTEEVQSYLQIDVHNASTWHNDKKLSLNVEKSGCTLLGARYQGYSVLGTWFTVILL